MKSAQVIREYSSKPFVWGESDCCCFVRDCLKADGRKTAAMALRWGDKTSADMLLLRYGGLRGLFREFMGEPLTHIDQARRGDIALVEHDGQEICAYVTLTLQGRRLAVRTLVDGGNVTDWPIDRALAVWRPS